MLTQLINILIAVIVSIMAIIIIPGIAYDLLKDKAIKKKSFFKFLFSRDFLAYIFLLPFGIAVFHGIIDLFIGFPLRLFKINYHYFSSTKISTSITIYYGFLCFLIFAIVASLFHNKAFPKIR